MRIVFLDFDGVLNSRSYYARAGKLERPDDALDREAVARLNRILERTGAKVVISSTWRTTDTMDRIREILAAHGFVGEIIGATPVISGSRGEEIDAWLSAAKGVRSYVVLDDASDTDPVRKRHVQTTMEHGLLDEHVDPACALLERTRWWPF